EARARLAQALLDSNQPAEAELFIAPVADDLARNDATALAISVQALARSRRPQEANARLARLVAIEPRSPRVSSAKAWVLFAEGMNSARAANEAGSPREALRVAVNVALARRDDPKYLKEADTLAELARSKAPKAFDVLVFQALIRHLQERYEEEVALYREVQAL